MEAIAMKENDHAPLSEMGEHALCYAEDRGWKVFPCANKHPLTKHGFHDASSSPAQIETWWTTHPNAQIGVATGQASGFWVLDIDGPQGDAELAKICQGRPIYTATVRTSKGRHYYFRSTAADPGTGGNITKVPDRDRGAIDIRSAGGYVIGPPSIHATGHRYAWEVPLDDMTEAPDWLLQRLHELAGKPRVQGVNARRPELVEEPPLPISTAEEERIRQALDAIPSDDYDEWCRTGMALKSTLAGEQAFQIWLEWSSKSPKFEGEEDCREKWASFGRRNVERTISSIFWRADQLQQEQAPISGEIAESSNATSAKLPELTKIEMAWQDSPAEWLERSKPTPRRYLLQNPDGTGMLPLGKAGTFTAAGGIGKTQAVFGLAIAVATKRPWFNYYRVDSAAPTRVLLILGEEEREEVYRRMYSAAEAMGLSDEEWVLCCDRIVTLPLAGEAAPFLSISREIVKETAELVALRRLLFSDARQSDIGGVLVGGWGLIVIDPLARFAGVDAETSNLLATRFVQAVEGLCRAPGGPTVIVVGHSSKSAREKGKADSRGVTALTDGFRWHATMTALDDGIGVKFEVAKNNYAAKQREPLTLIYREDGALTAATIVEKDARSAKQREEQEQVRAENRRKKQEQKEREDAEALAVNVEKVIRIAGEFPGIARGGFRPKMGVAQSSAEMAIDEAVRKGDVIVRESGNALRHYIPGYLANEVSTQANQPEVSTLLTSPTPPPPVPVGNPAGAGSSETGAGGVGSREYRVESREDAQEVNKRTEVA